MIKFAGAAFVSVCALLVNASASLAASDPTQVAKNSQAIFEPMAKIVWWILLVSSLFMLGFSRRSSRAAGVLGLLALAGIVLYNPAGVGSWMQGLSDQLF